MIKAFGLLLVGAFVTANAISERCGSKCDALFSEETHQVRCLNRKITVSKMSLKMTLITKCFDTGLAINLKYRAKYVFIIYLLVLWKGNFI